MPKDADSRLREPDVRHTVALQNSALPRCMLLQEKRDCSRHRRLLLPSAQIAAIRRDSRPRGRPQIACGTQRVPAQPTITADVAFGSLRLADFTNGPGRGAAPAGATQSSTRGNVARAEGHHADPHQRFATRTSAIIAEELMRKLQHQGAHRAGADSSVCFAETARRRAGGIAQARR